MQRLMSGCIMNQGVSIRESPAEASHLQIGLDRFSRRRTFADGKGVVGELPVVGLAGGIEERFDAVVL